MDKRKKEIRALAEQDLYYFISLVAPERVLGDIHKELITWWNREEAKSHQLVLLPRAHQKSALAAYRVAWEITRNPAVTILYVSSTTPLAINQLRSIKNILTSDKYRTYWPEMINEEEGKREEWAAMRFCVDHPKRKKEGVRDSTVMASGITTNLTGFHCDIAVLDDIITKDNAYSEMGREQVKSFYSFMASIENTDASEWVIGTRYHPKDLYDKLIQMRYIIREPETGGILSDEPMFDVFARVVENSDERNGTGQFLWPSQKRYDGRTFGFDVGELAKKKAQYDDMAKFYCFTPDTLVYTDRGISPIGDIRVGDVFSGNKVLNLFQRKVNENILQVKVAGVPETISVTKGHIFPVRIKTRKKDYGTNELLIGDVLSDTVSTKRFYLEHKFDITVKDNKWPEDIWWLIGHYLAEGYLWKDKYICLVTRLEEEKNIHTKLRNIFKNNHIKYHEYNKESVKIFYITYPELHEYLSEFGYMSYGKKLNKDALLAPHSKQKELIDGYLKGDGFKLKRQEGFGITSVSLELLENIKDVLLRLGEVPYIVKLYEAGSRKSFGYNVRTAYSIRWYGKGKQKNFIEGNKYYQQIYKNKILEVPYIGDVNTLEVVNSHEYNVMGLTCKNSQYYNDPTDPSEARITPACFQYYNPKHLKEEGGVWFLKERRLNIFAGMDFAYSLDKRADNTAIVIIGVDEDNNIYILDIDVFKTTRISVMRERLLALHRRWNIKKVCAETNMGQKVIVEQFKEDLSQEGVILPIESKYRTRHEGTKLERVTAVLQLRYFQKKIWHFKGYNCQTLESELQAAKPDHDDIEDALASAIEISKAPFRSRGVKQESNIMYHSKFGGVM